MTDGRSGLLRSGMALLSTMLIPLLALDARASIPRPTVEPHAPRTPVVSLPILPLTWQRATLTAWGLCRAVAPDPGTIFALRIDVASDGRIVRIGVVDLDRAAAAPLNACLVRRLAILSGSLRSPTRTVFVLLPGARATTPNSPLSARSVRSLWNVPLRRAATRSPDT